VAWTFPDTFQTAAALVIVNMNMAAGKTDSMRRTCFNAVMAADAFPAVPEDLDPGRLAFRIRTPSAVQRASLEKDDCTDAGTVIEGKLLNVEDDAGCGPVCSHV